MKTRLLWLFVLCCGLLMLMSLMVVGEEQPQPMRCEDVRVLMPVSLKPAPEAQPEGQMAASAPHDGHALPSPALAALRPLWPVFEAPYKLAAYYAFHPSDEAG